MRQKEGWRAGRQLDSLLAITETNARKARSFSFWNIDKNENVG
jgi:hypothetical protein